MAAEIAASLVAAVRTLSSEDAARTLRVIFSSADVSLREDIQSFLQSCGTDGRAALCTIVTDVGIARRLMVDKNELVRCRGVHAFARLCSSEHAEAALVLPDTPLFDTHQLCKALVRYKKAASVCSALQTLVRQRSDPESAALLLCYCDAATVLSNLCPTSTTHVPGGWPITALTEIDKRETWRRLARSHAAIVAEASYSSWPCGAPLQQELLRAAKYNPSAVLQALVRMPGSPLAPAASAPAVQDAQVRSVAASLVNTILPALVAPAAELATVLLHSAAKPESMNKSRYGVRAPARESTTQQQYVAITWSKSALRVLRTLPVFSDLLDQGWIRLDPSTWPEKVSSHSLQKWVGLDSSSAPADKLQHAVALLQTMGVVPSPDIGQMRENEAALLPPQIREFVVQHAVKTHKETPHLAAQYASCTADSEVAKAAAGAQLLSAEGTDRCVATGRLLGGALRFRPTDVKACIQAFTNRAKEAAPARQQMVNTLLELMGEDTPPAYATIMQLNALLEGVLALCAPSDTSHGLKTECIRLIIALRNILPQTEASTVGTPQETAKEWHVTALQRVARALIPVADSTSVAARLKCLPRNLPSDPAVHTALWNTFGPRSSPSVEKVLERAAWAAQQLREDVQASGASRSTVSVADGVRASFTKEELEAMRAFHGIGHTYRPRGGRHQAHGRGRSARISNTRNGRGSPLLLRTALRLLECITSAADADSAQQTELASSFGTLVDDNRPVALLLARYWLRSGANPNPNAAQNEDGPSRVSSAFPIQGLSSNNPLLREILQLFTRYTSLFSPELFEGLVSVAGSVPLPVLPSAGRVKLYARWPGALQSIHSSALTQYIRTELVITPDHSMPDARKIAQCLSIVSSTPLRSAESELFVRALVKEGLETPPAAAPTEDADVGHNNEDTAQESPVESIMPSALLACARVFYGESSLELLLSAARVPHLAKAAWTAIGVCTRRVPSARLAASIQQALMAGTAGVAAQKVIIRLLLNLPLRHSVPVLVELSANGDALHADTRAALLVPLWSVAQGSVGANGSLSGHGEAAWAFLEGSMQRSIAVSLLETDPKIAGRVMDASSLLDLPLPSKETCLNPARCNQLYASKILLPALCSVHSSLRSSALSRVGRSDLHSAVSAIDQDQDRLQQLLLTNVLMEVESLGKGEGTGMMKARQQHAESSTEDKADLEEELRGEVRVALVALLGHVCSATATSGQQQAGELHLSSIVEHYLRCIAQPCTIECADDLHHVRSLVTMVVARIGIGRGNDASSRACDAVLRPLLLHSCTEQGTFLLPLAFMLQLAAAADLSAVVQCIQAVRARVWGAGVVEVVVGTFCIPVPTSVWLRQADPAASLAAIDALEQEVLQLAQHANGQSRQWLTILAYKLCVAAGDRDTVDSADTLAETMSHARRRLLSSDECWKPQRIAKLRSTYASTGSPVAAEYPDLLATAMWKVVELLHPE